MAEEPRIAKPFRALRAFGSAAFRAHGVSDLAVCAEKIIVVHGRALVSYHLATGERDEILETDAEPWLALAALPNGKSFLTVDGNSLEVNEAKAYRTRAERPFKQRVDDAAIAPSGKLALVRAGAKLHLIALPSASLVRTLKVDATVGRMACAWTERRACFVRGEQELEVLDLETGKRIARVDVGAEILGPPAFTVDDAHVLVPTTYGVMAFDATKLGRTVTLRHYPSGTAEELPDRITAVAVSATVIATAHDRSGVVSLWDWPSGRQRAVVDLDGEEDAVLCFAGDTLWVGVGSSVTAIDVVKGVELPLAPGLRGRARSVHVGEDVVIACGARSSVRAYELATGELRWSLPLDGRIEAVAFHRDVVAIAADTSRIGADRDLVELFGARDGRKLSELTELRTRAMDFLPDGRLVTGDYSGAIELHGGGERTLLGTAAGMPSALAATDDATVAVLVDEGPVQIFAGEERTLDADPAPTAIAWLSSTLYVGHEDGKVTRLEGDKLVPFADVGARVRALATSRAGLLAVSSDEGVWTFDVASGKRIGELERSVAVASALAFDPSGALLVTGDIHGKLLGFSVEEERAVEEKHGAFRDEQRAFQRKRPASPAKPVRARAPKGLAARVLLAGEEGYWLDGRAGYLLRRRDLGTMKIPSGKLTAIDPYSSDEAEPLAREVGHRCRVLALVRTASGHSELGGLLLRFSEEPVARWEHPFGVDDEGRPLGVAVDSAAFVLGDCELIRRSDEAHAEGPKERAIAAGGAAILDTLGAQILAVATESDGGYPLLVGLDALDEVVCVLYDDGLITHGRHKKWRGTAQHGPPPTTLDGALRWVHEVTSAAQEPLYLRGRLAARDRAAIVALAGADLPKDVARFYAKYRPAQDLRGWTTIHRTLSKTYGRALFPIALDKDGVVFARIIDGGCELREWRDGQESGGGSDLLGYLVTRTIEALSRVRASKCVPRPSDVR